MDESGRGFLLRLPTIPAAANSFWMAVREYCPVAKSSMTRFIFGKNSGCGSIVRSLGSLIYPSGACRAKYLAWMHQERVQRPDGEKVVALHPSARVQEQHYETFAFRVEIRIRAHMEPPVFGGLVGRVANQQRFGQRAFAECHHLVFLGDSRRVVQCECAGRLDFVV